ncbi:DUF7667 family protein [Paenibacillus albicereus]
MIGISPIHRKLAELTHRCLESDGQLHMTSLDRRDLTHYLQSNLALVRKLDELKSLAYHAYEVGDMDWHNEICRQIDETEATLV